MPEEKPLVYSVTIRPKVYKRLQRLPLNVQAKLRVLLAHLRSDGPVLPTMPNYSKLGPDTYHCHLGYHYAACWRNINGTIEIEVHYVGTRQGAPY